MIEEHKFGSFVIDGKNYLGDIKIVGSRVRYWENRLKHSLNIDDFKDVIESGPEVIVIGTGNSGLLKVNSDLKDFILSKRIKLFVGVNESAVEKYNEALLQRKNVAAIFHATC